MVKNMTSFVDCMLDGWRMLSFGENIYSRRLFVYLMDHGERTLISGDHSILRTLLFRLFAV